MQAVKWLMYAMLETRPDLTHIVDVLSCHTFCSNAAPKVLVCSTLMSIKEPVVADLEPLLTTPSLQIQGVIRLVAGRPSVSRSEYSMTR